MSEPKPEERERKTRSGPSSGSFKVARVEVQELAALAGPEVISSPGADLLSDELLVDRVLQGDGAHYEALMRRTAARSYRISRGIVGTKPRAEIIVQEAFVRAYENLSTYDRRLRFGDWLCRIAIHGALASLKRVSQPPPAELPGRQQLELVRQLEDTVDSLPESLRLAFTLCVLDEMAPIDAAQTLGVSVEDLRMWGFRGRLRVRRQLGIRSDDAEARAFAFDLTSIAALAQRVRTRLSIV